MRDATEVGQPPPVALVWWAWSAFVWAANAQPAESHALRISLLAGTVRIFIAGLALPRAFAGEAMVFVVAYVLVRGLHLGLYVDASRRGNAASSAIAGFAVTVGIGMAMLIAGAALTGWALPALGRPAVRPRRADGGRRAD
jgi:low temperature requirement protein LtrA